MNIELTETDYDRLCAEIATEFPAFKVVPKKDSSLMKAINVTLQIITLGLMKSFMTGFITTISTTVYVPEIWNDRSIAGRMRTLRHERIHMRQARRHGRLLFSLMYLLLPVPTVFAVCRRNFEREAYEESLRATQEYHGDDVLQDPSTKENIIEHFVSAEYFWMWPWKNSMNRWYDAVITKLLSR